MNISEAYTAAIRDLCVMTEIPELEASVLLSSVLNVSRTYLYTWPEKLLNVVQEKQFLDYVKRRRSGEPIPYILRRKEFWSLDFVVTPDVLIPRQETELLVEIVLEKLTQQCAIIADLGTGSGAIGLSLAHERPLWQIHAAEKNEKALAIAQLNKKNLQVDNVLFHLGHWCNALPVIQFDAIVSNPPYIAADDPELSEEVSSFEPLCALISEKSGFQDIEDIIFSSRHYLKPQGLLCIEHGYQQAQKVARIFEQAGYTGIDIVKDLAGLDRVTFASWPGFDIN